MYLDIKTPVAEWIRQIREFRPNIVIGYPKRLLVGGRKAGKRQCIQLFFRNSCIFKSCPVISGMLKPGYFVYDEDAWNQMLLGIIRAALWDMSMPQILRLLIKRPRIVYIAATDGRYGGAMAVGDGIEKTHPFYTSNDI